MTALIRRSSPTLGIAVAGAVLTLFVTLNTDVRFAYDNLSLHVALETGEGLIAGLLAFLAIERYRAARLLRDLLLAWTFAVLATTNLLLCAVPMVSLGARPGDTLTWLVAGLRLAGAVGLCTAAFTPLGSASPDRSVARATRFSAAVVVVFAVASLAADAWLGSAVDATISAQHSDRPNLVAHPVVLGLQLAGVLLYGAAAVGFRRQASAVEDPLLTWLAAGAVFAAFARVHFFLFPSLYSNYVYTGDLRRLTAYLCFLGGAARQIDTYRREQTHVAVLAERNRVARELHDGVVQELAFIRSHTRSFAYDATTSPDVAEHIAAAAERALVECRHAIEILTSSDDEHQPVADLLRRAADDVARRGGTRVEVRGSPVAAVPDHVRAALQRVVREATTNAVAHGHAGSVTIDITAEERHLRLTIADDGAGFDVTQPRTGFGLRSMRERVEEVSGTFAIRSAPGEGTVVVATVPLSRSAR